RAHLTTHAPLRATAGNLLAPVQRNRPRRQDQHSGREIASRSRYSRRHLRRQRREPKFVGVTVAPRYRHKPCKQHRAAGRLETRVGKAYSLKCEELKLLTSASR